MALNLNNKTALITGASSGIGAACAETFAEQGINLIITGRREQRLKLLAQQLIEKYKVKVLPLQLDVCDRAAVYQAIESLENDWRNIDIIINNAGVSLSTERIQDTNIEKMEKMIQTNLNGAIYITKAILPTMLERNTGHIINMGSLAAFYTYPGGNIYAATKHALKAFSQMLRIDLLGTSIRVSQIDPGATKTEISEVRWDKEKAKAYYDKMVPLHAKDIAESTLFCATREPHINIDNIIISNIDIAGCFFAHMNKPDSGSNLFD